MEPRASADSAVGRLSVIIPIGFGAVVINTMPVWLGELASRPGVSDVMAGALGSLVLLSAALACAASAPRWADRTAGVIVPALLALLAVAPMLPLPLLVGACCGLGLALGAITGRAIRAARETGAVLRPVSAALTLGLVASMAVYLMLPVLGPTALWLLFALSLALPVCGATPRNQPSKGRARLRAAGLPLRYLPFFVMMGAYWSFLEIFGRALGEADALQLYLLGSLMSGAAGAFLGGRIPPQLWPRVQAVALMAAATTGAVSYAAPNMAVLGVSILANGFFLFLFFPLYLASHGEDAAKAMAGYLLGFAFGGLVGAVAIQVGGYGLLALAILVTGLAGLGRPTQRTTS